MAPLPPLAADPSGYADDATAAADRMPSGWWILPILALSCLAWGGIGAAILL